MEKKKNKYYEPTTIVSRNGKIKNDLCRRREGLHSCHRCGRSDSINNTTLCGDCASADGMDWLVNGGQHGLDVTMTEARLNSEITFFRTVLKTINCGV